VAVPAAKQTAARMGAPEGPAVVAPAALAVALAVQQVAAPAAQQVVVALRVRQVAVAQRAQPVPAERRTRRTARWT
jgi:hypothetical protein